ncbi:hypothetical protein NECAME_08743 [Necator americanus]|uniref:Uncharacterized protein n=1 Tax=Necator americanus TaxID=51031 RepID=W2TIU5_NECAM|nr:hypothetical protein NECAME_08743 [Necator americanus]ETN81081.1 hypothetical protein NECAME_08743 [Necator americanus]
MACHCKDNHSEDGANGKPQDYTVLLLTFDTVGEFEEWSHEQCERSGTSFFKRSTYAKGSSYSLRCNRAGTYEKATTSNATSSKKDVISCSCFMNVHIADNDKVNIKGCLGHVGHDIEPALLRLNNTQELLRTLLEVMITPTQLEWLRKFSPRGIAVDDTHNVTRYNLKLATVSVADNKNRGLPAVSGTMTTLDVQRLFLEIKKLLPDFNPQQIVTDEAPCYYNGFRDRRRLAASSFRVQQSTKYHRWALKHYENRPEKVKRVAEKKWELQRKDVAD